jgi:hypothetical protein
VDGRCEDVSHVSPDATADRDDLDSSGGHAPDARIPDATGDGSGPVDALGVDRSVIDGPVGPNADAATRDADRDAPDLDAPTAEDGAVDGREPDAGKAEGGALDSTVPDSEGADASVDGMEPSPDGGEDAESDAVLDGPSDAGEPDAVVDPCVPQLLETGACLVVDSETRTR